MSGIGRSGHGKAVGMLIALSVGAGLLSASAVIPIIGVAGVATRDVATTFNNLPVSGLGQLPARSEILNSSGQIIAYYYPRNIYRIPVTYGQIAPVMRDAIISIEDSRFYQHGALDLRGTLRALATTLAGTEVQGGSDIAQQYVKNACILTAMSPAAAAACSAETVARKVRELRIAANIMRKMNKHQLLAAYLNAVYFENESYGIEVASRFYFSTPASRLTLPEAAMLAGLVQNPYAYDPLLHPQAAKIRRNEVLARMRQLGYISLAVARRAEATPLGLRVSSVPLQTGCISPAASKEAFFCQYVLAVMQHDKSYAKAWSALNTTGGLRIYTTLSAKDQAAADYAVNYVEPSHSNYYNPGHNADTEVIIQPGTGDIRALAINRKFGTGRGETTINYAVNTPYGGSAGVQTGSSSKIFTLVTALKQGLPFGYSLRVTSPTTVGPFFNCSGGYIPPYTVINAEGPQGPATWTIYTGTVASINAFYVTLEQRVGLCNVVKTAAQLGMTRADGNSLLRRDPKLPRGDDLAADNYPSFTLGTVYVSPMDMADAYATVDALGIYCKPTAITAITGPSGARYPVQSADCHRVLRKGIAEAANYVFQGVLGPGGTGYNRGIGIPAAAKTGTADGGFYAAFAGFTPLLTGYVSVFNPVDPTGQGAMVGTRSSYREVDGYLAQPGQMFGDNAPGATWQLTFLRLHLRPVPFRRPPYYPYFELPLTGPPPKTHSHSPGHSPTGAPTTPVVTPTPTPTMSASPSPT